MLIDTHCHLDLMQTEASVDYLQKGEKCGIKGWLIPGVHPDGWQNIAALAKKFSGVYAAFGIHPRHATEVTETDLVMLEEFVKQAVAIGEIGLDRRYGNYPEQEKLFRAQIRLALAYQLPLLIHNAGMTGKVLSILSEEKAMQVGGIMHLFNGSVESAREFLRIRFLISPGKNLLRKNNAKALKIVQELKPENLVLESDAPGTAENDHENHPCFILKLAEQIAKIKNRTMQDITSITGDTVQQFFTQMNSKTDKNRCS